MIVLKLKDLIRYVVVMTIAVVALGTFLRLATRCEPSVLRSLVVHDILACALLRPDYEKPLTVHP
jgi:hypothetical protein